jgi:carbon monoxide dehydrogenase subunit G
MSAARARRRIGAPAERVWAAATDVAGACERMSGVERIELLSDGPFGVGTRWRETRIALDQRPTEEMLVVDCDPPRRIVLEVRGGDSVSRAVTTLVPAGPATTDVEVTFESTPRSVAGRLLGAVLGTLAARTVLATLNRDLEDLARWCEQVDR